MARGLLTLSLVLAVIVVESMSQNQNISELRKQVNSLFHRASNSLQKGDARQAIDLYLEAIKIAPNAGTCYYNLAVAYKKAGEIEKALAMFSRATQVDPRDQDAHQMLCQNLMNLGRLEEAVTSCANGIMLRPTKTNLYVEISKIFRAMRVLEYWHRSLITATRVDGKDGDSMGSLASFYFENVHYDKAVVHYHFALRDNPDHEFSLIGVILAAQRGCRWNIADRYRPRLLNLLEKDRLDQFPPYHCFELGIDALALLHVSVFLSRRHVSLARISLPPPPLKSRLKIGYLCANGFHERTTVARFIYAVFGGHNKEKFETVCFSMVADDKSKVRRGIRETCGEFVDLENMSHAKAATTINQRQTNVLVDLVGLAKSENMFVLSLNPAPRQMHLLGYPGTLGAASIPYLVGDKISTPPEYAQFVSEKLLIHPLYYLVNSHSTLFPKLKFEDTDTRRMDDKTLNSVQFHASKENAGIIFASFNQQYKFTRDMFTVWVELLRAVPQSVLWMIKFDDVSPKVLREFVSRKHVDPKRAIFTPFIPKEKEFETKMIGDVGLDTHGVGGHTTTVDFLWSCVPVVTLPSVSIASRVAASIILANGLTELISRSHEDYFDIALALAKNTRAREELRSRISPGNRQMKGDRLWDTALWTRMFEVGLKMAMDVPQDRFHLVVYDFSQ